MAPAARIADRIAKIGPSGAQRTLGMVAITASALYLTSDVIEAGQGGFSAAQLWITLIAEAAIPAIMVGLAMTFGPRIGRLGQVSAWGYAYSYVFFTATVIYALARSVPDYTTLADDLRPWMVVHGAVMVVSGLGFGFACLRGTVTWRWAAGALMAGVVLVAATQDAAEGVQLLAAGIRDLGIAAMGLSLLAPVGQRAHRPTAREKAGLSPSARGSR